MASLSSNTVPFNTGVPLGRTVDADAMFRLSTALAVSRVVLPAWPVDGSPPSGAQAKDKLWSFLAHPEWDANGYAHYVHTWREASATPNLEGQIKDICKYRIWWMLFNDAAWKLVCSEQPRPMGSGNDGWSQFPTPTPYIMGSSGGSFYTLGFGSNGEPYGGLCADGWIDGSMQGYDGTYGCPLSDVHCDSNSWVSAGQLILPTLADERYSEFWGAVANGNRGLARDWMRTAAGGIGLSSWLPTEQVYTSWTDSLYALPRELRPLALMTYREMIDEPGAAQAWFPYWFGDVPPVYWGDGGSSSSSGPSGPLLQLAQAAPWGGAHRAWADAFPYQGLCAIFSLLYYLEQHYIGYLVAMVHHSGSHAGAVKHYDRTSTATYSCSTTMSYTRVSGSNPPVFRADSQSLDVRVNFSGSGQPSVVSEEVLLQDESPGTIPCIEYKESRHSGIEGGIGPAPGEGKWSQIQWYGWWYGSPYFGWTYIVDITNSDPLSRDFWHAYEAGVNGGATPSSALQAALDQVCIDLFDGYDHFTAQGDAVHEVIYDTRELGALCDYEGYNNDAVDFASRRLVSSGVAVASKYVFFAETELVDWSPTSGGPGGGTGIGPWVEDAGYAPLLRPIQPNQRMDNKHVCIWSLSGSMADGSKGALQLACGSVNTELLHRVGQITTGFYSAGNKFGPQANGAVFKFPYEAGLSMHYPGESLVTSPNTPFIIRDGGVDEFTDSTAITLQNSNPDRIDSGFSFGVYPSMSSGSMDVITDDGDMSILNWEDWKRSDEATTPYSLSTRGKIKTAAALVKFPTGRIC